MEEYEKEYWERQLSNRFVIGEQIGYSGAATSAYRLFERETDKISVLLIPCEEIFENKEILQVYMDEQRRAENFKSFCSEGYTGDVLIPTAELGENYRIMPYAGVDFTYEIYSSLSEAEQKKLAFDFATYLNFVHQKSFEQKPLLDLKFPGCKIGEISHIKPLGVKLESYIKGKIPEEDYQKLQKILSDFEKRDVSDEINVIIHGDLRNQNILYDVTTKKLAIIDYELACSDNIYKDLCPCASSKLSPQFLADVIRFYNEQPKKYPVRLDERKVALIQKAFLLRELVYCGEARGRDSQEILRDFIGNEIIIDNYYGIDSQRSKDDDKLLLVRNVLHKNLKRVLNIVLTNANVSTNMQKQLQDLFDQQIQTRNWQEESSEFHVLTDLPSDEEFTLIKQRANNVLECIQNAPIIKKCLPNFTLDVAFEKDPCIEAMEDCSHIKEKKATPKCTLGVFNPHYYGEGTTKDDVDTAFACILAHELGHTIVSLNMPYMGHIAGRKSAFWHSAYGDQISCCKEFICDIVSVVAVLQTGKNFDVMRSIFQKTRTADNKHHTHWQDIFQMYALLKRDFEETQTSKITYISTQSKKQNIDNQNERQKE